MEANKQYYAFFSKFMKGKNVTYTQKKFRAPYEVRSMNHKIR